MAPLARDGSAEATTSRAARSFRDCPDNSSSSADSSLDQVPVFDHRPAGSLMAMRYTCSPIARRTVGPHGLGHAPLHPGIPPDAAHDGSSGSRRSDGPPYTPASTGITPLAFTSTLYNPVLSSVMEGGDVRRKRIRVPAALHSMVAGAGAGLVSSIATCPLDVVKTTLQAQSVPRGAPGYEGVTKTCIRIYRQSGVRGFYRGLGPTVAGYLPTWGIYFTVYDFIKDRLRQIPIANAHPDIAHVTAAMTAGATGTILTNPLWVVKTRFMAQAILPPSAPRYKTTFDAVRTIYTTEGFRAFYKGLLPSLMGVSHVAVQFGLYEKTKAWACRDGQPLTPTAILACSAFSKMVASLATYPHEVLRTRIQVSKAQTPKPAAAVAAAAAARPPSSELYSPLVTGSNPPVAGELPASAGRSGNKPVFTPRPGGIIDVFRKIYHQDGWRGFYRGLSINLVRTVPSSAVTMLTYELIMRNLS